MSGMSNSAVVTGVYSLQCAAPMFSPAAGAYTNTQAVTLSSATGGATIRYTTDGSTPSQGNGTVYSTAVNIGIDTTLKAIAYLGGMSDSAVASGDYTIDTLPSPWETQDIGTVIKVGSAGYSNATFTLQGAGSDIGGTADALRYVYQISSGDCDIMARVIGVSNTSSNSKAGVMIRETLNANAMEAGVWVAPGNAVVSSCRTSTGDTTSTNGVAGLTTPCWVRVTRATNSFSAYYGTNGTSWTQLGSSTTIGMATNAFFGLGVCSGDTNNLCIGTMDDVTVVP